MKIELKAVSVRELAEDYEDNNEGGVAGYGGKLDIRPAYQREFIYKDKQRNAVIDTVTRNHPLNVMYWAVRSDGDYEVIDGQQRTISICQFVEGDFAVEGRYFHNLQSDEQEAILDYPLMVYVCSGTPSEKLEWFKTINIAGEKLTAQELRNAVYTGPWLSDAKAKFSKSQGPAYGLSNKYVSGVANRQELLEKALEWIVRRDGGKRVEEYMSVHQHDPNALELWTYFRNVVHWVEQTFVVYRKEQKGIEWGPLYDAYKDEVLDTAALEKRVAKLMQDDDVTKRKGIYAYVLTGDQRHLSIRQFSDGDKRAAYERQNGLCANKTHCLTPDNSDGEKVFSIGEMEADHITPWSKGGKTEPTNCQMLCLPCNRQKGGL
jgi:hypothetical protein